MIARLLIAFGLMALCVSIHAWGITVALRWTRLQANAIAGFRATTWLLVRVAGWVVLLHLVEIVAWALIYAWRGAMPDLPTAVYFSAVTYTTTGYGDVVLPEAWRLVGAVEALTGILMCGWSTGFFFAVVREIHEAQVGPRSS